MHHNSAIPITFGLPGWNYNSGHFKGKIDETRIYNRMLSSTEVEMLYNHQETDSPTTLSDLGNLWQSNATNIYHLGKVSVNSNELPDGFDFAVDGKAIAKKIKVTLNYWPDYIFENDYKLLSSKEVEQFITKKKHLPEIPNRDEVLNNGILIGEMNARLLKKIEELTFYIINQEKKIKKQSKKIEMLESLSDKLYEIEKAFKTK